MPRRVSILSSGIAKLTKGKIFTPIIVGKNTSTSKSWYKLHKAIDASILSKHLESEKYI